MELGYSIAFLKLLWICSYSNARCLHHTDKQIKHFCWIIVTLFVLNLGTTQPVSKPMSEIFNYVSVFTKMCYDVENHLLVWRRSYDNNGKLGL